MDDRINFYHTPIDREILKDLTKRSDLQGLLQSLGILLVYAATTAVSLYFFLQRMWLPMVLACYLHSMFAGFLGMASSVHELSHTTPFKTKWLNEVFYYLFAFLTWNNPVHFRESHRRHHQLTTFRGRDKEVIIEPAPFTTADYVSWFFFDWKIFRMLMRANWAFFRGKDQPDVFFWDPLFEKDDPKRQKMIAWARFQFIGHLILAGVFAYFQLWVLIYTVSLSYFFATFMIHATGMVQHIGLKPNVPDWRMNCHTMIFGPVMAFFYWRMNYHIEHHMYASVPFFNLHKLHKVIGHDLPEPVRGFFPAVGKILGLVRKQRKDPRWVYVPVLPPDAAPAQYT